MRKLCELLGSGLSTHEVGGKSRNLERVSSLGLKIPESIVVTRSALGSFLDGAGLRSQVAEYMREFHDQTPLERDAAHRQIASLCLSAALPPELQTELAQLAESLLADAPFGLAVRSSAVCEDGASASFAGIFESALCTTSRATLELAVRRCWASLFTPRALLYARGMQIDIEVDGMAVLVQKMLDPESSGVIFTAEPTTGNPWRFVVDSTFGLLQHVVDARAPADSFILDWRTGELLEREIAQKRTALRPGVDGATPQDLAPAEAGRSSLDPSRLAEIHAAALAIDESFDCRVDVEWVVDQGGLTIVQARPITALPEFFPHVLTEAEATHTWSFADKFWYRPAEPDGKLVAPLGNDTWWTDLWTLPVPEGLNLLRRTSLERDFNGYRYETGTWAGISEDLLEILDEAGEHEKIRKICDEHEKRLDEIEARLRREWLAGHAALLQLPHQASLLIAATNSAEELTPLLCDLLTPDPRGDWMGLGAPQSLYALCGRMLRGFVEERDSDFQFEQLILGTPSVSHLRVAAAQQYAHGVDDPVLRRIICDVPLAEVLSVLTKDERYSGFLRDYRELCVRFGCDLPSWVGRPWPWVADDLDWSYLLAIMRKTLRVEMEDLAEKLRSNEAARKTAAAEFRGRLCSEDLARFDKLLEWTLFWVPVLDNRLWGAACKWQALHDLLWHSSTRLIAEGVFEVPAEILLLETAQLRGHRSNAAEKTRKIFLRNRDEYRRNRRLNPPARLAKSRAPEVARPDSATEERDSSIAGALLRGKGRSPGVATGRAYPATGELDMQDLCSEDVLVCVAGLPYRMDWIALYLVVRGIVVTQASGAALHHALQLAREFGVPYVELAPGQADAIAAGARIRIDGTSGTVEILDSSS